METTSPQAYAISPKSKFDKFMDKFMGTFMWWVIALSALAIAFRLLFS